MIGHVLLAIETALLLVLIIGIVGMIVQVYRNMISRRSVLFAFTIGATAIGLAVIVGLLDGLAQPFEWSIFAVGVAFGFAQLIFGFSIRRRVR